jgi:hypothetical protein
MGFYGIYSISFTLYVCLTVDSSQFTMADLAFFGLYPISIKLSEQFFYCLILELNTDFIIPFMSFQVKAWV